MATLPPPACLSSSPLLFAIFLIFLRLFGSPSTQRWQCVHSKPFPQPDPFQNQKHGLHAPELCKAEPKDGIGIRGMLKSFTSFGVVVPDEGTDVATSSSARTRPSPT
jgi:hypothetical protein